MYISPYASEVWILILLSYTSVHNFVACPVKAGIRGFTNIPSQRKELLLRILKIPGSESNHPECGLAVPPGHVTVKTIASCCTIADLLFILSLSPLMQRCAIPIIFTKHTVFIQEIRKFQRIGQKSHISIPSIKYFVYRALSSSFLPISVSCLGAALQ